MPRLENDPFLNELTSLYTSTQATGTVYISFKQYVETKSLSKGKRKMEQRENDGEYCCLIRARAKNKKISTILKGKDIVRFQMALTTIQKAHMDGLKKREKQSKRGAAPRAKKE